MPNLNTLHGTTSATRPYVSSLNFWLYARSDNHWAPMFCRSSSSHEPADAELNLSLLLELLDELTLKDEDPIERIELATERAVYGPAAPEPPAVGDPATRDMEVVLDEGDPSNLDPAAEFGVRGTIINTSSSFGAAIAAEAPAEAAATGSNVAEDSYRDAASENSANDLPVSDCSLGERPMFSTPDRSCDLPWAADIPLEGMARSAPEADSVAWPTAKVEAAAETPLVPMVSVLMLARWRVVIVARGEVMWREAAMETCDIPASSTGDVAVDRCGGGDLPCDDACRRAKGATHTTAAVGGRGGQVLRRARVQGS